MHHRGTNRSRGGLTTKIHTRANADGLGIGFRLTPGQASDMSSYTDLMDDDLPDPTAVLADKGYDSDAIRADLEGGRV
ncbi:transposase [Acidisphaera rubrifaciens]|uniref:transposase n=1 Tax=Acidisphaera rubrifaciens TaxID=50715 RepID=UPI0035A2267F